MHTVDPKCARELEVEEPKTRLGEYSLGEMVDIQTQELLRSIISSHFRWTLVSCGAVEDLRPIHPFLCREMVARAIHEFMRSVLAESGTDITFLERTFETLLLLQAYFATVVTCSGHGVSYEADGAGYKWQSLYHDMFLSFPHEAYCQPTGCIRMFIKLWYYEALSISFLKTSDASYSI